MDSAGNSSAVAGMVRTAARMAVASTAALYFLMLVIRFLLFSVVCVAFSTNTISKDQLKFEKKLQSKMEKTEVKFKRTPQ